MDKDLLEGKIGSDGAYSVVFKDGKLHLEVKYEKGITAGILVEVDSDWVLDAIAKAIPGQIDDAILALIKSALKV